MEKTFTVNIPDEIYIDSWINDETASFTYSGPESVYIAITPITQQIGRFSLEAFAEDSAEVLNEDITILEINANTDTALAHYIVEALDNEQYTYTYISETNHDGSEYAKPTNYRLKDYFSIVYDNSNEEIPNVKLEAIINDRWRIPQYDVANERLQKLIYNRDNITHSEDILTGINTAISELETYLTAIESSRKWKYDAFDFNEIPNASIVVQKTIVNIPPAEVEEPVYPPAEPELEEV